MGKVTFEFNEDEERHEIDLITNRHKMIVSLYEVQKYKRDIDKGYESDISSEEIVNRLDCILDRVKFLLD